MNILTAAPHATDKKRSFFVKARNAFEQGATFGLYDPEGSHREEVDQRDLIGDQINAYKEQTNLARDELNRKRGEQEAEKRKINEKQIRALRRNYRPAGFLNNAASAPTGDLTQNLGG